MAGLFTKRSFRARLEKGFTKLIIRQLLQTLSWFLKGKKHLRSSQINILDPFIREFGSWKLDRSKKEHTGIETTIYYTLTHLELNSVQC